jgi:hypothetical protein
MQYIYIYMPKIKIGLDQMTCLMAHCDGIHSQYLFEFNKLAIVKDMTNGVPFHE